MTDAAAMKEGLSVVPPQLAGLHARRGKTLLDAIDASPLLRFTLLALFALIIRGSLFGTWIHDADDAFYSLAGQRMLDGAELYTEVWDRKGPVLYLLFAGISAISRDPLAYAIAATVSAVLGAWGVAVITERLSGPRAGLMAGLALLAMMNRFAGETAQAPVFYNTLMIAAAWSIVTRLDALNRGEIGWRIVSGMACASLAVGMKQSVAIEAGVFGLIVAVPVLRAGRPTLATCSKLAALAVIGVAPYALAAAWYGSEGRFDVFWNAIVSSNFNRLYVDDVERLRRFAALLGQMGLAIAFAALGWRTADARGVARAPRIVIALWFLAAVLAVAAFPNIFSYYGLPLLPPLCILAGEFFAHREIGRVGLGVLVVSSLWFAHSFDLAERWRNHHTLEAFETWVAAETPHKHLLVWGNPSLLYARIGAEPPVPLAFARHLFDGAEAGASGTDEVALVRALLAANPETVVVQTDLGANPLNEATVAMVQAYLPRCAMRRTFPLRDRAGDLEQTVYSRCVTPPSR